MATRDLLSASVAPASSRRGTACSRAGRRRRQATIDRRMATRPWTSAWPSFTIATLQRCILCPPVPANQPDTKRKVASVLRGLLRRAPGGDRAVDVDDQTSVPATELPSVGLALGGGAARGFAHIGVIQCLLAHGIKPDVVAGTSMGAVIGGCYAAGGLDDVTDWARSLTRRRILGYLDVSLAGSGLISGGRLAQRLEKTIGTARIEQLATRFAAIATELDTGHEVWLTRGRLLEALRASYALPGVFAPVRVGGRWLVDGALVNPVPVAAARSLGARLVIGVSTNAGRFGRGATIHSHGFEDDEIVSEDAGPAPLWRGKLSATRLLRRRLVGSEDRP